MRYPNKVRKLEAEVEQNQEKYSASLHAEEDIIKIISLYGFSATCRRVRLLAERQARAEKIRRNKITLAWARN